MVVRDRVREPAGGGIRGARRRAGLPGGPDRPGATVTAPPDRGPAAVPGRARPRARTRSRRPTTCGPVRSCTRRCPACCRSSASGAAAAAGSTRRSSRSSTRRRCGSATTAGRSCATSRGPGWSSRTARRSGPGPARRAGGAVVDAAGPDERGRGAVSRADRHHGAVPRRGHRRGAARAWPRPTPCCVRPRPRRSRPGSGSTASSTGPCCTPRSMAAVGQPLPPPGRQAEPRRAADRPAASRRGLTAVGGSARLLAWRRALGPQLGSGARSRRGAVPAGWSASTSLGPSTGPAS